MTSAVDLVMRGLLSMSNKYIMHQSRKIEIAHRAFYRILKKGLKLEDVCVCSDLTNRTTALGALELLARRSAEQRNNGNYLTLIEQIELGKKVKLSYERAQKYIQHASKMQAGL